MHSHFVATVIGEFSSKAQALLIEVATKILKDRAYSFTREIHRVDGLAYYPETMVLRGTGCAPSGPKSRTAGDFRIHWARTSSCPSRHLGSDGVNFCGAVLVEPSRSPDTDFHYRIFNSDGSEVEQCGNGACAAVAVGRRQGLLEERVRVSLPGGDLVVE